MDVQDIVFTRPGPEFAKRGPSVNAGSDFSQLLEQSSGSRGADDTVRDERVAESDRPGRRDRAHTRGHYSHRPEDARGDDRPTRRADQPTREKPNDIEVSDASDPKDQPARVNDSRGSRHKDSEKPADEAAPTVSCAAEQSDAHRCGEKQSETEIATAAADIAPATLPAAAGSGADGAAAATGTEQVGGLAASPGQPAGSAAPNVQTTSPGASAMASPGAPRNAAAAPKVGDPQTATKTDGSPASKVQDPNSFADPDTAKAAEAAPKSSGQTPSTDQAAGKPAEQAADLVTAKPAPQKEQSQSAPNGPDHPVAKAATAKPDHRPVAQSNAAAGNTQNAPSTNAQAQAPGSAAGAAAASAAGTPDTASAGTTESGASETAPTTSDGSNLVLANRAGGTSAAHTRPVQLHGIPVNNVAVHIRRAVANGQDHLRIRLHPAELGDVDVRMKISHDGAVRVVVSVDRPETFDLMQRDARNLERALQDAGLKTDSGSLSFNLRDHGPGGFDGREASANAEPSLDTPSESLSAIESAEQELVLQPGISTRALDIRV